MGARIDPNESPYTGSRHAGLVAVEVDGRLEVPPRDTLVLPADRRSTFGEQYTIQAGDRIDVLAFMLLGDSRLWWLLAELNPSEVPDPLRLVVGTTIFVPHLEVAAEFL